MLLQLCNIRSGTKFKTIESSLVILQSRGKKLQDLNILAKLLPKISSRTQPRIQVSCLASRESFFHTTIPMLRLHLFNGERARGYQQKGKLIHPSIEGRGRHRLFIRKIIQLKILSSLLILEHYFWAKQERGEKIG